MENTMLIALTNRKAARLLHELEELHLIKVLQENVSSAAPDQSTTKLSAKYRGMISSQKGKQLHQHIRQMRSEWNDT